VTVETGPERLFTFLDAVVAIAITLLVLPLAELLAGGGQRTGGLVELYAGHAGEFGAFLLSFAVIARLWWAHHRLGERVGGHDAAFVLVNLLWVLTIVVLPFATQVVTAYPATALPVATYVGTMTLSSASLTLLAVLVHRRDGLRKDGVPARREDLVASVVTTVLYAVALVLGTTIRAVNYYGLLLLLLSGPIERLVARVLRTPDPS
jgi:uncharacterized membrane protein